MGAVVHWRSGVTRIPDAADTRVLLEHVKPEPGGPERAGRRYARRPCADDADALVFIHHHYFLCSKSAWKRRAGDEFQNIDLCCHPANSRLRLGVDLMFEHGAEKRLGAVARI